MVRNVSDWMDVIGYANATNEGDASAVARRILYDLKGYRHLTSTHKEEDVKQLANAIQAYAKLLHVHGVTP